VGLAANRIVDPDNSHRIPRLDPTVVAACKARLTLPARLAVRHGRQLAECSGWLKRKGLRLVLDRAGIGVDFARASNPGRICSFIMMGHPGPGIMEQARSRPEGRHFRALCSDDPR
jgi:hypothetical protein